MWHPSRLPRDLKKLLRAGVTSAGDLGRLQQALTRLERGDSLVLSAVGASVTADYGGALGRLQDRFDLAYTGNLRKCTGAAACEWAGWLLPVFSYLTRAANDTMATSVSFANVGQAGTGLSRYLECTGSVVPEHSDIILVDASTVDYGNLPQIERTLRRLLSLPRSPALILLHFFDWCSCQNCVADGSRLKCAACSPRQRSMKHRNGECYRPDRLTAAWSAGARVEDPIDSLAQHYSLPV